MLFCCWIISASDGGAIEGDLSPRVVGFGLLPCGSGKCEQDFLRPRPRDVAASALGDVAEQALAVIDGDDRGGAHHAVARSAEVLTRRPLRAHEFSSSSS